ncbi:L-fuculose phosphate aldolase [Streptomyces antimycoticus]
MTGTARIVLIHATPRSPWRPSMTRSQENELRERLTTLGASLFARGLTTGTSGNLSVRVCDGWLMTPTNASLGTLDPDRLSKLDENGRHVGGDRPTKESLLHLALYRQRRDAGGIVHLHSTYAAAVSCMEGLDPVECVPPLTAYFAMRIADCPSSPTTGPVTRRWPPRSTTSPPVTTRSCLPTTGRSSAARLLNPRRRRSKSWRRRRSSSCSCAEYRLALSATKRSHNSTVVADLTSSWAASWARLPHRMADCHTRQQFLRGQR